MYRNCDAVVVVFVMLWCCGGEVTSTSTLSPTSTLESVRHILTIQSKTYKYLSRFRYSPAVMRWAECGGFGGCGVGELEEVLENVVEVDFPLAQPHLTLPSRME